MDEYERDEYCYECTGYGDNYFVTEDGELECRCPYCWCFYSGEEDDYD